MDGNLEESLNSSSSWIPIRAIKKLMGFRDLPMTEQRNVANCDLFSKKSQIRHSDSVKVKTDGLKESSEEYIKLLEARLAASQIEKESLSSQIHKSELQTCNLRNLLSKLKQDQMIRIQDMQEQHERKLLRTKKDLDYILKEMNNQSNLIILDDFMQIHMAEMEKCRAEYESIFQKFIKKHHKGQLIEYKMQKEIENLRYRYQDSVERLKERLTGAYKNDLDEDNISTGLNSERVTSEMNPVLETTAKVHFQTRVNKLT